MVMVDQGVIDKYSDLILEINEYVNKPEFVKLDNNKYLVDYQDSDGYNTYAIIKDNKVYGLAYDENSNAVSIVKDSKVYIMNQEKLLQKYNENDYLEEELGIIEQDNNKYISYTKILSNCETIVLAYLANHTDYRILFNYLLNSDKRPYLISMTKPYFRLGPINLYKTKNMIEDRYGYKSVGKIPFNYTYEEVDELLASKNLPNKIPDEIINTYLDKDNKIKILKRVANEYKNNYI